MKTILKIQDDPENEDNLKNENNLKIKDNPLNENKPKAKLRFIACVNLLIS